MRLASLILLAALTACAAPRVENEAARARADLAAAERARSSVAAGNTKSEVLAALGKGQVIPFDSGYEVWVYRMGRNEIVVLFGPDGLVAKSRLRNG
jgi:hypothetical protein